MMHALVRRDVAMFDDPLRAQSISLAIGGLLAVLVLAAGVVVGLVRGNGVSDSAPIVMARETGALYVRVGDTLHPVPNLASARLVARSAAAPVSVDAASIAALKRGPLMGIPGAPAVIGEPLRDPVWTVCDDDRTVVVVGRSDVDHLESSRSVLVTPRGEGAATTYLLYGGRRAAVDLRNVAVVRTLRLDGIVPVPVSQTLLDIVPEVPAITPPSIAGAGTPGPAALAGAAIGAVVSVGGDPFVVLREGLQRVGEVAADLIRYAYDTDGRPPITVAPNAVASLPVADELPVGTFPRHAGTPVGAAEGLAVCARWRPDGLGPRASKTVVVVGESPYGNATQVTDLAQADGPGPAVDAVAIPGGASVYVRSARILGDDGAGGARFLVTDAGVAFGVHDDDTATFLGLGDAAEIAPWPVVANLPRGPELGVDAALVVRDGFPTPS